MRVVLGLVAIGLWLGGCAQFQEDHYFKSENTKTGQDVNYYRLRITGTAGMSSARYIAGFYDERAVDLFFNELRSTSSNADGSIRPIFQDNQKSPGTNTVIKPLDPSQHGAFVMILSTNANAVANAIGNFADSNVVADAITNIANRGDIRESQRADAEATASARRGAAVSAELTKLIGEIPEDAPDDVATEGYLRVLNAIAKALDADQRFTTLEEADAWFKGRRGAGGS